jgi:menaquinone-9 beta-reductase
MGYDAEVVIVGAGVAGGALATALARQGVSVLLLEKSRLHQDRVRGEFMVPWGVSEVEQLGLLDVLLAAGAHFTPLSVPYEEGVAPDGARAQSIDLRRTLPNCRGAMNISHPRMCQALDDAAEAAGATVLRGISDVSVAAGDPPTVAFTHDLQRCQISPKLVVGADGRGSAIARQIGAVVQADPEHHLLGGMLVDGVQGWPEDEYSIGVEGDIAFYVFPQGGSRVRLYICQGLDQPHRFFSGHDKGRRFLDAFRLSCLPQSEIFSTAIPAGPCRGYPNADCWIDTPTAAGIVLIGDAAGHNDPTIGQGLSISFRDARIVSEALLADRRWTRDRFAPYVEERRERMRRLRFVGRQYSRWRAEFDPTARARRQRALERMALDPSHMQLFAPLLQGPFDAPDHVFELAAWDRLLN